MYSFEYIFTAGIYQLGPEFKTASEETDYFYILAIDLFCLILLIYIILAPIFFCKDRNDKKEYQKVQDISNQNSREIMVNEEKRLFLSKNTLLA